MDRVGTHPGGASSSLAAASALASANASAAVKKSVRSRPTTRINSSAPSSLSATTSLTTTSSSGRGRSTTHDTKTADGRFVHRLNYRRDRQRVEQVKTRRTMTPDLIARVAQIHNTTPEGSRIAAIRAAFGIAERQALRYIAQARKDGLIKNDDA
jgi:hypothetical protein